MKQRIRNLGAWLVLGIAMLSQATGQTLPTLVDDTRNTFSQQAPDVFPPRPPSLDVDPRSPAPSQWQSGTVIDGWRTTRIKDGSGAVLAGSPDSAEGPTTLLLPHFTPRDGDGNIIPDQGTQLESVQMARPLSGRVPTVFFGDVIPRPLVDNNGIPVSPTAFLPEPANAQGGKFYYSPHARSVFATQAGEVVVTWQYRDSTHIPATLNIKYIVSATPTLPTRRMFWTEKGFNGPVVQVLQGPITTMNVIYNSQFPSQVATEYDSPYDVPADPALQLPPEKRTFWFSTLDRCLHAYNAEGRVFVEILGALTADGVTRNFLGAEIVEVIREVAPLKVETLIGEKILPTVPQPVSDADKQLFPKVINGIASAPAFLQGHTNPVTARTDYYAIRTTNQPTNNPGQPTGEVLMYWMQTGDFGLEWPRYYQTYVVTWPESLDLYSMYIRQNQSQNDAASTGVKLDADNTPLAVFQDDPTGKQAQLKDGQIFYTNVGIDPAGRSLIQYSNGNAIWFERVYSQLNTGLPDYLATETRNVGERIDAPVGFESAVGYIRHVPGDDTGTAFDATAYIDPFKEGMENAKKGAIIGVNARPGKNILEVWWFKPNSPPAGSGLKPTYWPAAVRRYALTWPAQPAEIVLASNEGSGELPSLQATGSIYYQNNSSVAGFNPNDEHALMLGDRAWALRDDLYREQTSLPYVLLRYTESDSRPAMRVFKVLREKEAVAAIPASPGVPGSLAIPAIKFNYTVTAGKILQGPMPLPVLPLPYDGSLMLNTAGFTAPVESALSGSVRTANQADYTKFVFKDRKDNFWVYRGPGKAGSSPVFTMKYFYTSMKGFYLPGEADPAPGTIMPYLRNPNGDGTYQGEAKTKNATPLEITFQPQWPNDAPQLRIGETLTTAKYGLPDVRNQTSLQVIYQQSVAESAKRSAVIYDPTCAKTYALAQDTLSKLPDSVITSNYKGKTWFPNLPPHLSQRFYFDPSRGKLRLVDNGRNFSSHQFAS